MNPWLRKLKSLFFRLSKQYRHQINDALEIAVEEAEVRLSKEARKRIHNSTFEHVAEVGIDAALDVALSEVHRELDDYLSGPVA